MASSAAFGARLSDPLTHGLTDLLAEREKKKKKRKNKNQPEHAVSSNTWVGALSPNPEPLVPGLTAVASSTPHACQRGAGELWGPRGSDPHPCHPVLSVPLHRHRWRHATTSPAPTHGKKKSSRCFQVHPPASGPAPADHEPQKSARERGGGLG